MNTSTLIDYMPDVAEKAKTPWARRFASSICRQSLRSGWHPSPKQARLMKFAVWQLPDDCDGFEVIDHGDDFAEVNTDKRH